MKSPRSSSGTPRAFTLLEMTIVILVLLSLMQIGIFGSRMMTQWRLGRAASEQLRSVYSAQRMYLADNPTVPVANLTPALLLPYMPGGVAVMPQVTSLTGAQLGFIVTVSPPVINNGAGVAYDPSGSNRDSLWDVGE